MDKILSIDPSGTGTSGIFFTNGKEQEFTEIKSNNWKEHYFYISQLITEKEPSLILFEDTNYIHKRTSDSLSLFRLLGALECLTNWEIKKVNVLRVKELYRKLLENKEKLTDLVYTGKGRGRGWIFRGKRVNIHQLEAYLVYYLFKNSK